MKNKIKIILSFALACVVAVSAVACGKKKNENNETTGNTETPQYTGAEALLAEIWAAYSDNEKFPVIGGDEANMSSEGPGKYSVEDAEILDNVLGFPAAEVGKIDGAASLMHAMNQNTFTCAAYHFKNASDVESGIATLKSNILARQWICGFPDSLLIISVPGNYVITVWGIDEGTDVVSTFKEKVLNTVSGAKVVVNEDIV